MTTSPLIRPRSASRGVPKGNVQIDPADRLMVIAPHPDDESLAAAGLVMSARAVGATVRVVYMTSGQNNPWAQLVAEGRWPRSMADRERWGARRRGEALAALASLAVPSRAATFLDLPDQGLTDLLIRGAAGPVPALASELETWRPTVVVSPALADRHPDHSASAVLLRLALRRVGLQPRLMLEYFVHVAPSALRGSRRVRLGPDELERKRAAVLSHHSQLWWRRRQFLGFLRDEAFELGGTATFDDRHPVRRAWIQGKILHLDLAPTRMLALGAPTLHALFDLGNRRLTRSFGLPGWRRASSPWSSSRDLMHVEFDWHRDLTVAPERPLLDCLVKVEWPRERRLGLFDAWGWRAIPVPSPVKAEPELESTTHAEEVASPLALRSERSP